MRQIITMCGCSTRTCTLGACAVWHTPFTIIIRVKIISAWPATHEISRQFSISLYGSVRWSIGISYIEYTPAVMSRFIITCNVHAMHTSLKLNWTIDKIHHNPHINPDCQLTTSLHDVLLLPNLASSPGLSMFFKAPKKIRKAWSVLWCNDYVFATIKFSVTAWTAW